MTWPCGTKLGTLELEPFLHVGCSFLFGMSFCLLQPFWHLGAKFGNQDPIWALSERVLAFKAKAKTPRKRPKKWRGQGDNTLYHIFPYSLHIFPYSLHIFPYSLLIPSKCKWNGSGGVFVSQLQVLQPPHKLGSELFQWMHNSNYGSHNNSSGIVILIMLRIRLIVQVVVIVATIRIVILA